MITLGIIGVVAAMTMPVLIQNARNRELEAGLKKGASTIAQALNMYEAENGEPITSKTFTSQELKYTIMKYFNVLIDCDYRLQKPDSACIHDWGNSGSYTYMNFNGTNYIWTTGLFGDGQFVLADKSIILIKIYDNDLYLSIDINGCKRGPNRLGQDLFMFQVDESGNLRPMGLIGTRFYNKNDETCSKISNSNVNGAGCTYKALSDPSFWKNLP